MRDGKLMGFLGNGSDMGGGEKGNGLLSTKTHLSTATASDGHVYGIGYHETALPDP